MPINAYTGLMGSGKTYEVVSSVIVPAIKAGRRVVTNIDGLNEDAVFRYCIEKLEANEEQLGKIVHVSNTDVSAENFFFHGTGAETIVQPGDLVAIDEAWRFWGVGSQIYASHMVFFREHRHYAHLETRVTCDLVLMVQNVADLHRQLRNVVEITFKTTKLKMLGLNKRYRVDLYDGCKVNMKSLANSIQRKYDPEVFKLYSSYVGAKGKELQIDKRQNVLKSPKLIAAVIGAPVLIAFLGTGLWKFLHPSESKEVRAIGSVEGARQAAISSPAVSAWRIIGLVHRPTGETLVYLQDDRGYTRTVIASAFVLDGFKTEGFVDGEKVSFWSGRPPAKTSAFMEPKK